jgi:hypothetical protein
MTARRLRLGLLVWLCGLLGVLVLGASGASAALTHEFLAGISTKLSEGIPAVGPHGEAVAVPGPPKALFDTAMTVDGGELYVAEGAISTRLDRFDAGSGAFLGQFPQQASFTHLAEGVAVGRSAGEAQVYVAGDESVAGNSRGVVAVLGSTGGLLGVWRGSDAPSGEPKAFGCFGCVGHAGIAVDGSSSVGDWAAGDVYVPDAEKSVVDVFKPEAGGGEEYVAQLAGPEPPGVVFSRPVGVAVNQSDGRVYVLDREPGESHVFNVDVFRPAAIIGQYEYVGRLAGTGAGGAFEYANGLTVDGGNGDVYVAGSQLGFVDQFDSAGEHVGRLTGTPGGPFHQVGSVAVDPESHDVYVADYRGGENNAGVIDAFGRNLVIPDVVTEAASSVTPGSTVLNGTVNPDGEGVASCRFEWGTGSQFGHVVPCEPEGVPDGTSPVAVHATVPGLQPDTTYYYRLQATNKNGTNPGQPDQDQQFTTAGPGIHSESTSNVTGDSATLEASINPHNAPSTYYFQYGTDTSYGTVVPGAPGIELGSGEGDVEVSRHVQSLTAGTVYHYRVVAVSEPEPGRFETFDGADQTFATQIAGGTSTSSLPDGRAWEMVSPPQKLGALIEDKPEEAIQASVAGNAFTYMASSPSEGDVQGYSKKTQIFSVRGSSGWSSRDIATPYESATGPAVGEGNEYRFFSEDLTLGAVQPFGGFIPASSRFALAPREASEQTPFLHTNYLNGDVNDSCVESCYRPLVSGAPGYANVGEGVRFGAEGQCPGQALICGPQFIRSSPDLRHVVLGFSTPLLPGANSQSLYEWTAGKLTLVSVLPGGSTPPPGTHVVLGDGGNGAGQLSKTAMHAISNDGSRVVWMEVSGHLYVRDTVGSRTVQLDVPESGCVSKGTCGDGQVSPLFQAASSDGSRVFFTDTQRLTEGSGGGATGINQRDLYECQIVEVAGKLQCQLSDLTPVQSGEVANVQGVLGASDDGSYVYFAANGVIAQGAVPGNCHAGFSTEGLCNLYVWHEGTTKLVAIVSGEDGFDWTANLEMQPTRVSRSGKWLAFMSQRNLTGYDTRDAVSGVPDQEVYLYDASGAGRLVCASCNPTGARPVGIRASQYSLVNISRQWEGHWLAGNIPPWITSGIGGVHQPRYLSDEGRLFFDSSDALVPQDVNGKEDVYQYEQPDVGGCTTSSPGFGARSGGCIGLISSGASAEESAFVDASETGGDVFFVTTEKLVSQDFDASLDMYDAHECSTSAPCLPVAAEVPPACSTADGCRAAPSPQPSSFGAPSSATFSGAGNVTQASGKPPAVKGKSKSSGNAKLARALKACHAKKIRHKRIACESRARRRFGSRARSHKGGK